MNRLLPTVLPTIGRRPPLNNNPPSPSSQPIIHPYIRNIAHTLPQAYQLPPGSIHLSTPLVHGLDQLELYKKHQKRKRRIWKAQNRGKIMLENATGSKYIKMPQAARLSLERSLARKDRATRSIANHERDVHETEQIKRNMGSKYSGAVDTSPVIIQPRPTRFQPGGKHVRQGRNVARNAQSSYEKTLTNCEAELFHIANTLSRTYKKEWHHWTEQRAQQLQKNARIHLSRTILSHYSNRIDENEQMIKKHLQKKRFLWCTTVLKAWCAIAKKRFSFRAFLIRCRTILHNEKRKSIFYRWKKRTFLNENIQWRRKYYSIILNGTNSRRKRMRRIFVRWKNVFLPLRRLLRIRAARLLKDRFMKWFLLRRYLSEHVEKKIIFLQKMVRRKFMKKKLRQNGQILFILLKRDQKSRHLFKRIQKRTVVTKIQNLFRQYLQKRQHHFVKAIITLQSKYRINKAKNNFSRQIILVQKRICFQKTRSKRVLQDFLQKVVVKRNPLGSAVMEQYLMKQENEDEMYLEKIFDECDDLMILLKKEKDRDDSFCRRKERDEKDKELVRIQNMKLEKERRRWGVRGKGGVGGMGVPSRQSGSVGKKGSQIAADDGGRRKMKKGDQKKKRNPKT